MPIKSPKNTKLTRSSIEDRLKIKIGEENLDISTRAYAKSSY